MSAVAANQGIKTKRDMSNKKHKSKAIRIKKKVELKHWLILEFSEKQMNAENSFS